MKKQIKLIAVILFFTGNVFSQIEDIKDIEVDTTRVETRIKFPNMEIIFLDDTIKRASKELKFPRIQIKPSLDVGVAGFYETNKMNTSSFLSNNNESISNTKGDLKLFSSSNISFDLRVHFRLNKNIGFVSGIGSNYNAYEFKDNVSLTNKTGAFNIDTNINYSKYRFIAGYVQVPVLFRYQTKNNNFNFSLGGTIGYNVLSRTRFKYSLNGGKYRGVITDDYGISPIKVSLRGEVMYQGIGLYVNYGLSQFKRIHLAEGTGVSSYDLGTFETGLTFTF